MAMEIERKFLLGSFPENLIISGKRTIFQSYLAVGREEVRIRRVQFENSENKFYLTYKNRLKGKLARQEVEIEITDNTYNHLNNKSVPIIKDRYLINLGNGKCAEIDIFKNAGYELETVEVEFNSVKEAESFMPPEWFGRELTGTGEHGNQAIWEGINGIKEDNI